MKKILYGTGNEAKLSFMRKRLSSLGIELFGLKDLHKPIPEIEENGSTPLENARMKAQAYFREYKMPVFSCDSGLYFDNIPEELQPGVHVRRVNGRYLNDEEMIEYYAGLAKKYGDITARYKNAICFILKDGIIYESMDESLSFSPFILTSKPHEKRVQGFPLDSLSIQISSGKYYFDIEKSLEEQPTVDNGFTSFFRQCLLEM